MQQQIAIQNTRDCRPLLRPEHDAALRRPLAGLRRPAAASLTALLYMVLSPGLAVAQSDQAQTGTSESAANAQSQTDQGNLETVTVTATPLGSSLQAPSTAGSRLDLSPLQTPASVTSIPGDVVRDLGITTVAAAETLAPGFSSVPTPGNGGISLSARGFYGSNAISELYDGMQLFNAGGVVTYPFDPWNVQSIDVLTGPASVLYGTGAIGGAVNVISKQPDPTQQLNTAQVSYGTFETLHAAVDSTGPITPELAYRGNVSVYNSNGWTTNALTPSQSLAASGGLRLQAAPTLVLSLSDDFGDLYPSDYEGTPVVGNHVVQALRFISYNLSDPQVNFRENRLNLREDWTPSSTVSFTNNSYLITQYRDYHDTYNYTLNPTTSIVTRNDYRDIRAQERQEGDHAFVTWKNQPFGLNNQTLFGFDLNRSVYYRQDNEGPTGSYPGSTTVPETGFDPGLFPTGVSLAYPIYDVWLDQMGAFAEDHLELPGHVSLAAGVREDHYGIARIGFYPTASHTDGDYDGTGWNIGAVYQPIQNLSLYAQYASATNPVTSLASDSAADITFGLSPAGQEEIGAKQLLWDDRFQWTLAFYHIVEHDLLTSTAANPTVSQEVGSQASHGVELSFSARPISSLVISANGTTLKARFDDFFTGATSLAGYRPYLVPQQTGNVLATWTFVPQWQVRGMVQYVGQRFMDNTDKYPLPAYAVWNFGLRWLFSPKWNADLAVNNATDKVYASAAPSGGSGNEWLLGEPRSVMFTLNAVF